MICGLIVQILAHCYKKQQRACRGNGLSLPSGFCVNLRGRKTSKWGGALPAAKAKARLLSSVESQAQWGLIGCLRPEVDVEMT